MAKSPRLTSTLLGFMQSYWLIIVVIFWASLLRVWSLDTQAIFFGDAGRDMLVAANAVETRQVPLLGIPSSVPRFHQGPLTIWMEMVVFLFVGRNLLAFSFFFAVLSVLAIIALYELLVLYADKRTAVIASTILAFSPLAIAHARVPYHTTPIPLMLVLYFFSLMHLWRNGVTRKGLFLAIIGFCGVFQFELAVLPSFLLIPYVLLRKNGGSVKKVLPLFKNKLVVLQVVGGFVIGLLPQLLYDLTHRFTHLGGFGVWVVYRVVSFLGYKQEHTFSADRLSQTFHSISQYFERILSVENPWLFVVMLGFLLGGLSITLYQIFKRLSMSPITEVSFICFGLLMGGYIIHGAPSEAYFPPFLILIPIFIGYALSRLIQSLKQQQILEIVVTLLLTVFATVNAYQVIEHNFFVSNQQEFNYGPAVAEQRQVIQLVERVTKGQVPFTFRTTRPEGEFTNYFDNLRWLASEKGMPESPNVGISIFVEPKDSPLHNYPEMKKYQFATLDVYVVEF